MMDESRREEFARLRDAYARQLRQERDALLVDVAEGEIDLRSMESDRANEVEERAQQADAARMFAHLDERRKQRLEEIDRVLQRIALGTYGLCERRGEPIPAARLRALPTARVHVQCADDGQGPSLDTSAETPLGAPRGSAGEGADDHIERLPPDIRDLSDEEVEHYIREHLRDDGRVDAHELRITYRAGVITLEGTVPSEEQHQMVLQYVTDFARVQEVADRLVIDALVWEREDRPGPPTDEAPSSGTLAGAMEELIESDQESQPYDPPDGPVREET
jgi:RNA polymerase-binding transcription factor